LRYACRYAAFVETLDTLSRDNLEFVKDRAVKTMYELLSAKPEQEARLLAALVNKLGDPDRKLASKVGSTSGSSEAWEGASSIEGLTYEEGGLGERRLQRECGLCTWAPGTHGGVFSPCC
jgi:hypothetical protein